MKSAIAALLVLACALLALPAMAQSWRVDAARSTLGFTNTYQGVAYSGQFHKFITAIHYDPADLAHAQFDVTVDITSFDTQNSERDSTALGADFFDAAKFPKAHFVTTAFHPSANGQVTADGVLSLRGISKPVTLDVKFVPHGDTATLDVTAHVKRLDFDIGGGQWADPSMIGLDVVVHGQLRLTR